MAAVNRVILIGNLTRDVQLKYLPNQTSLGEFGMAVNRKYKAANGEQREDVCFVDCAIFGKGAEVINQYCHKGSSLYVEGRLRQENWEDKNGGGKRSKLSVIVEQFQFIGDRQQGDQQQGDRPPQRGQSGGRQQNQPASEPQGGGFDELDIPFAHHPPIC
jgi:single-strand DNA-binding protein